MYNLKLHELEMYYCPKHKVKPPMFEGLLLLESADEAQRYSLWQLLITLLRRRRQWLQGRLYVVLPQQHESVS